MPSTCITCTAGALDAPFEDQAGVVAEAAPGRLICHFGLSNVTLEQLWIAVDHGGHRAP
jgi:hypothetical protein